MFDGRWRHAVDRTTKPVGTALVRAGITADVLTIFGLVMSVVTALAVGSGHLVAGIFLLFPTGLPDLFDGPVAKASGRASVRGAFFDSVADRISDAFLFGGVAWYLAARHHGEMVLLPFAILAVTSLISYQRAKAELLGLSAKGGLMERAERFILLGLCFIAGAVSAAALVPALWVFFGLLCATAVGRFVNVWKEAEGPPPLVPTRAVLGRGRHGRHASGAGPLARRTGGLALADLARSPCPSRRPRGARRGARAAPPSPSGRWRARRAGVPSSRSGRIWRARREARPTARSRPSARVARLLSRAPPRSDLLAPVPDVSDTVRVPIDEQHRHPSPDAVEPTPTAGAWAAYLDVPRPRDGHAEAARGRGRRGRRRWWRWCCRRLGQGGRHVRAPPAAGARPRAERRRGRGHRHGGPF